MCTIYDSDDHKEFCAIAKCRKNIKRPSITIHSTGISEAARHSTLRYGIRNGGYVLKQTKGDSKMAKRQVFYSFHFDNDVMRVQQIRNMGIIEGNTPVSTNDWEEARKKPGAIEKWINDNMKYRSCIIVLIGGETAHRPWVKYEIQKAWKDGKGLLGIYIHNLKCPRNGKCNKGPNPFEQFTFNDGSKLSSVVKCYNPNSTDAYNDIYNNIEEWIEEAIEIRK